MEQREWLKKQSGLVLEQHPKFTQQVQPEFDALIAKRRVSEWADFPEQTKLIYQCIAFHFPGQKVFACGSRVRGDYISGTDVFDIPKIVVWRKVYGKAYKLESDYDFCLSGVEHVDQFTLDALPKYADLIRHGIHEDEKILIPMEGWDFTKLPKSEHANVIDLFNRKRWADLAAIHDKYELSKYSYCCDMSGLIVWYRFGIQSGKIKA